MILYWYALNVNQYGWKKSKGIATLFGLDFSGNGDEYRHGTENLLPAAART